MHCRNRKNKELASKQSTTFGQTSKENGEGKPRCKMIAMLDFEEKHTETD